MQKQNTCICKIIKQKIIQKIDGNAGTKVFRWQKWTKMDKLSFDKQPNWSIEEELTDQISFKDEIIIF